MQMTKSVFIILSTGILVSLGILLLPLTKKNKIRFEQQVFHSVSGWGYDILVDGKLFIHQESIPSIKGNRGFQKKEQAILTAQLIINKMKRGELPTVTTFEVGQICRN